VYFTYKLPFKAFEVDADKDSKDNIVKEYFKKVVDTSHDSTSRYSMIFQKQSGIKSEYAHTVIYPDHWRPVWRTGENVSLSLNGASIHGILSSDTMYGIIMKQE
jgi:hypothetical protein